MTWLLHGSSSARAESAERYPETRTRLLQPADIRGWSDAKLRYAINEMYARHGADFTDRAIKQWFLRFTWYHPRPGRSYAEAEAEFNDLERQNVRLLGEARGNVPPTQDRRSSSSSATSSGAAPQSSSVRDVPYGRPDQEADQALAKELLAAAERARAQYAADLTRTPGEPARLQYVISLTEIAYRYMEVDKGPAWDYLNPGWAALTAELARHPAPPDSDSREFTRLRVGEWSSPRHDYIYRSNGTYNMLPLEPGIRPERWRIQGNRDGACTIILLNKDYCVRMEQNHVYFERRSR